MTVDEQLTQNNAIKLSDRLVVCFTLRVIPVGFSESEGPTSYQRVLKLRFSQLVSFSPRSGEYKVPLFIGAIL